MVASVTPICCGKHVGVCDWQSSVGVDGDAVENLEECLLVGDQRFDLGHGNLQLLDELFRCCVMNDMSRGEKMRSSPCAERNAPCAWTERLALARICRQCCIWSSAVVAAGLSLSIQGREGGEPKGEPEVCAHSTSSATLAMGGGRWSMWRPRRLTWISGELGDDKCRWLCCDRWLCCVVLCCVANREIRNNQFFA